MSNLNPNEPLFGGLIPRRVVQEGRLPRRRQEERTVLPPPGPFVPNLRQNDPLMPPKKNIGIGDKNVVFNWDEQKINLTKKALEIESERDKHKRQIDEKEIAIKGREQFRKETEDKNKLGIDKDKLSIDHRKQALDEWKARNPDGEIKVDKDGKLHVINKQTGASIDTGLTADSFDDEEKLKLQQKHAIDLEKLRQSGRKEIEGMRGEKGSLISPTQQRAAELDSIRELQNDPAYSDLFEDGLIEYDEDKGLVINRPEVPEASGGFLGFGKVGDEDINSANDINQRLQQFETDLKTKSDERMSKRVGGTSKLANGMIVMIDPRGVKRMVPEADVERLKALGGKVEGEEELEKPVFDSVPSDKVSDDIELTYNDKGKVIGVRNRKAVK